MHQGHTRPSGTKLFLACFLFLSAAPLAGPWGHGADRLIPSLLSCAPAQAAGQLPLPPQSQPAKQPDALDEFHKNLSQGVTNVAEWLDSFFGHERYYVESNRTELDLRLNTFYQKGDDAKFYVTGHLKLVLPQLKDRLHLIVGRGQDAGDLAAGDSHEKIDLPRLDLADDQDSFIALRYYILGTKQHNLSVEGGTAFIKPSEVDFYAAARFRELVDLNPWALRFTQKVGVYRSGYGAAETRVDVERQLSDVYLLRVENIGTYLGDEQNYYYDIKTSLYHVFSPISVIRYGVDNYFTVTRDQPYDGVVAYVSYRRRIHRQWLTLEIAPQMSFPRDKDYKFTPGILLRLEMKLGKVLSEPSANNRLPSTSL